LAIPDIHTLFAVEWAAFFKSSDAGINWTSIPISSRYHPSSIYFTDTLHGSITFSAGGAPFSGGYILTTFDGGVSWDTSGSADHYFVYYFTPKLGYALGAIELDDISFPFTRVTADGGKSWSDAGQHTFAAAKYENGNLLAFNNFTKLSKKSDSLFSIVQDYMGLIDQRIIAFETVSEHQGWLLTSDGKLFSQTDIQTSVHGLNCSQKITTELDFLNSPSLFRSSTTIRYRLPHSGVVHLDIFDIVGRKVGVLANEYSVEGIHEATWHAEHYASGIYFCRLTSGDRSKTIKLILRK
jgi:hypothetical protein